MAKVQSNRNDIKDQLPQEESNSNSRSNREDGNKITLPDGRVIIRRPTENLGQEGFKLKAPSKTGYSRRWVSDESDHRVQYFIDIGYKPAVDENGIRLEARRGGVRSNGQSFNMYLLEIPTEKLNELKRKNKEIDSDQRALEQQKLWLQGSSQDPEINSYIIKNSAKSVDVK